MAVVVQLLGDGDGGEKPECRGSEDKRLRQFHKVEGWKELKSAAEFKAFRPKNKTRGKDRRVCDFAPVSLGPMEKSGVFENTESLRCLD
jgi:hypothetical protein